MKSGTPQRLLSDTELRLIIALSELGPSTAPDLAEHLGGGATTSTVQRLLYRMADKQTVMSAIGENGWSRIWRLKSEEAFVEAVRAEVLYAVHVRYSGSRLILQALLDEFRILGEKKTSD